MTAIASIWAAFLGLPRWLHLAMAGALVFGLWLWRHDRAVIDAHEAKVAQSVATQAAQAASQAASAASSTKNQAEKENDHARQAAAHHPDDPLRAGFDSLRGERTRPAAKPAP